MAEPTPAHASYIIDRTAAAESPTAADLCAHAGINPRWLRPPDSRPVRSAGWLQPASPPTLAVVGCAAEQWLADAGDAALHTAAGQGLQVLLAPDGLAGRLEARLAGTDIALGSVDADTAETVFALRERLNLLQTPMQSIYAVLAEVFELGVLIVGPAGVGKSELALELLARGHRLVADDVVEVHRLPGDLLVGNAPSLLQDFLEVRGLGVLDVARMFGRAALKTRCRVDFMMELLPVRDAPTDYRARLAGLRSDTPLLDLSLPTICLPIRVGHNLATLVEAACRDQWLRLQGYRADDAFAERQQRAIDAQSTGDQEQAWN